MQTGVLHKRVLDNLDSLSPVMRDVAKYLIKTVRNKTSTEIGNSLIKFIETSDLSFVPYLRLWVTEIFLEKLALKFRDSAYGIFDKTRDQLGVRPLALLARELKYIDWVREKKEVWNNHGPWDRRAIIWSASILPPDERNFWLKRVQKSGDFLDKVIAKAVLAGVSHRAKVRVLTKAEDKRVESG